MEYSAQLVQFKNKSPNLPLWSSKLYTLESKLTYSILIHHIDDHTKFAFVGSRVDESHTTNFH